MFLLLRVRCYELLLGCSGGDVRQRGFQHVETLVKLRVVQHKRNKNSHTVAVRASRDGDQAVLVAVLRDPFGFLAGRFPRGRILDELDSAHAAEAADVADNLKLFGPLLAPFFEFSAEFGRAREYSTSLYH